MKRLSDEAIGASCNDAPASLNANYFAIDPHQHRLLIVWRAKIFENFLKLKLFKEEFFFKTGSTILE